MKWYGRLFDKLNGFCAWLNRWSNERCPTVWCGKKCCWIAVGEEFDDIGTKLDVLNKSTGKVRSLDRVETLVMDGNGKGGQ